MTDPATACTTAVGSALVRTRAQLIERVLATLAWCGYWPTHIAYRGESEARVMRDGVTLAIVVTHWPALDAADLAVRLSYVFAVPPLAPARPAFLDDWRVRAPWEA